MNGVTLALDAASSRLSVAATDGARIAERRLDGARQHTRDVLQLVDAVLEECGATPQSIDTVLTGNGPGSFTGLRVVSAVAKGLVWGRPAVSWWVAPSLLTRVPLEGAPRRVLAVSDALRGELYAGAWRLEPGVVTPIGPAPAAMRPADLARFGAVDLVVGTIPDDLVDAVATATGRSPLRGDDALPRAGRLLALRPWRGGLTAVVDPATWQPEYGRPAEAQAVWERRHGRPLPVAGHTPR